MAFRIDREIEKEIIKLRQEKIMTGRDIADELNRRGYKIKKTTVYKYLKLNKEIGIVPAKKIIKIIKINELISLHLLCFCRDLAIISKHLANEIIIKKPEKIIVPSRVQSVIRREKMDKVVDILQAANLNVNLEYCAAGR